MSWSAPAVDGNRNRKWRWEFEPRAGILHKGDGTNIYLKQRPRRVTTVLGDGTARHVDCRGCSGRVDETRLMAPVALASGRDGSLYIGDYNFIRKLASNREEVASVLQFRSSTLLARLLHTSTGVQRVHITIAMAAKSLSPASQDENRQRIDA